MRLFDKIKNFILYRCEKDLVVIYLIAIGMSILMFWLHPRVDPLDTPSYLFAKDQLLTYFKLDAFRPPLYPLFLAITYNRVGTIIAQNIIFLISIWFFYFTLKMLLSNRRLIFVFMLIYVIHPAFIAYNYILLTESLSISFSTIYLFFLIRYIRQEQTKDCWIFHILTIILILIKPAFLFLLGISVGLFIYQILFKRNIRRIGVFILPMVVVLSSIGLYSLQMKKDYSVFNVSCATDLNFYWNMAEQGLIDYESIENEELKSDLKMRTFDISALEVLYVYHTYGWKEIRSIVQVSMEKNRRAFLSGDAITKFRLNNFKEVVGGGPIGNFWKVVSFFFSITFFQLITILGVYFFLIVYSFFKTRKIPIVSITFFVYIAVNLFMMFFFIFNDSSRLAVPMLSVSLLIIAQLTEFVIHVIRSGKIKLAHLSIFQ